MSWRDVDIAMTTPVQIAEGRAQRECHVSTEPMDRRAKTLRGALCSRAAARRFSERAKEQGKPRRGRSDHCRIRSTPRRRAGPAESGAGELDLQTLTGAAGGNPQTRWARHPQSRGANGARPGRASDPQAPVGADLRANVLRSQLRLPPWAEPTPSGGSGT